MEDAYTIDLTKLTEELDKQIDMIYPRYGRLLEESKLLKMEIKPGKQSPDSPFNKKIIEIQLLFRTLLPVLIFVKSNIGLLSRLEKIHLAFIDELKKENTENKIKIMGMQVY